jgi:GxxExxY protein
MERGFLDFADPHGFFLMETFQHGDLTGRIINAYYQVYNELGYGFLENVYENALRVELQKRGFRVRAQAPISVFYDEEPVGEYFADLVVNDLVILEIKVADRISEAHKAQLANYLKATRIEVGLVLNFGPKVGIARRVFQTAKEKNQEKNPRKSEKSKNPRSIFSSQNDT